MRDVGCSMPIITGFRTYDVRFPTSVGRHGSDAMNVAPDYSAAYLVLETDDIELTGHGFVFTIGRGNDLQVAALTLLAPAVIGRDVEELASTMGDLGRALVRDSHLRWLGPEKGVTHMATGGVLNAVWDLVAKRQGKPLWKVLSDLTPERIVDLVDFRYLTDALTAAEALDILRTVEPQREANEQRLLSEGIPAYTTTPGWLGYDDETLARLCREAVAEGYSLIKLKVGRSLTDDQRRLALARQVVGDSVRLAVDANQVWDVDEAVEWINALRDVDLYWVEEPTSPDDVLGHAAIARRIAPTRVATGEHAANRIVFKQLLQASGLSVMQIDATRVAGVNENVANLLLAAKFGVPVCPHAGGVGLCEMVQHLAMFDAVAISGHRADRIVEYVDHLHEHFVTPTVVDRAAYRAPTSPGSGAEMLARSLVNYGYPDGAAWRDSRL